MGVEFDGSDTSAPFSGAYRCNEKSALAGDKRWKTVSLKLNAAHFLNSLNADADFRIVAEAAEFALGKVTLKRP